ncbi:MAG: DUF739 family protein [Clostridiales bacterium]|nr:DUF739 family protein [Clostridiales bacterium]
MSYNFDKLRGKIKEVFKTQYAFAEKMEWSERTCSLKIGCKIDWKQDEIVKACDLLGITENEIPSYFFNL